MAILRDDEFGDIAVKTHVFAKRMTARVAPSGQLTITMPPHMSTRTAQRFVDSARNQLRDLLTSQHRQPAYVRDQPIGKSHQLLFLYDERSVSVTTSGTKIIVRAPAADVKTPDVQQQIRRAITTALRKEAKSYLPRRLEYLAAQHGFDYAAVRFTHASSRWGSCSSRGTISLNIALMNLPFELLDYVLLHELAHTRHMNHSRQFWQQVGALDSAYQRHRAELRAYSPHI